ncbi:SMP-30/gluconolactonase/LRE family protein [Oricola indica]|uniref:SMP-30/gluconolactonase/LRE family protein n=1 Tax=Oricola indica TaxID=2872591 RepID=UPI003CCC193E
MIGVDCALRIRAQLGECPRWHEGEQKLYWVDIFGQTFNVFDPATGQNQAVDTPERINSFSFRSAGGLVAGCWDGFAIVEDLGQAPRWLWSTPDHQPGYFLNDGRCDRRGRFWAGTVNQTYETDGGTLYCLEPDGTITAKASGVKASNGIAFSPDDRTIYFADSQQHTVWAFDFDLDTASLSNRRVFAEMNRPDGAAMDEDGCYWVASYEAGCVLRWTPEGKLDLRIDMPVSNPSMCAFGGPNRDVLYVTTATYRLDDRQKAEQELAGSLFAITGLGTRGLPEPEYLG